MIILNLVYLYQSINSMNLKNNFFKSCFLIKKSNFFLFNKTYFFIYFNLIFIKKKIFFYLSNLILLFLILILLLSLILNLLRRIILCIIRLGSVFGLFNVCFFLEFFSCLIFMIYILIWIFCFLIIRVS
jgi:hypothetical protein